MDLEGITTILERLETTLNDVKTDVKGVKDDVKGIREEMSKFKDEIRLSVADQDEKISKMDVRLKKVEAATVTDAELREDKAIRKELHDKMFNMILEGIPDNNVWEKRQTSEQHVRSVLENILNITDCSDILILDAHR